MTMELEKHTFVIKALLLELHFCVLNKGQTLLCHTVFCLVLVCYRLFR